jgi:hypothetical protein
VQVQHCFEADLAPPFHSDVYQALDTEPDPAQSFTHVGKSKKINKNK